MRIAQNPEPPSDNINYSKRRFQYFEEYNNELRINKMFLNLLDKQIDKLKTSMTFKVKDGSEILGEYNPIE
ncbi:hypothetical protein C1645_827224 [Glomus cerebriforme]|uniref:Uncharacterized protein n=1 Tax=Glomus cerebriforme TaxID=658196 RepID=A0A397SYG9_9GLOM|nr:hypothetical protein C1645_827224 [Glomus cerebriforme]